MLSGLETDSEDELPPSWEERVNLDGKVYYANHETKCTQWKHPVTGKRKAVSGELPFGWERCMGEDGTVFFVDHINQKTTYTDPRLAFAEDMKTSALDFHQKFDAGSTALQVLHGRDLTGRYVIVTGANSGIGYETARSIALHGATVVMACRNLQSAHACQAAILKEQSKAKVEVIHLDLARLKSVREFAEAYKRTGWPLHILILNAAVFGIPWEMTEDGLEMTFQVNHLAHFYLVHLLQEQLISSAPARIVVVSSESHRFQDWTKETVSLDTLSPPAHKYSDLRAYNDSKLCNVLFAWSLDDKLRGQGVRSFSLHPGNMMSTSLSRHWWLYRLLFALVRPFTKSMQQGAATTVYCAVSQALDGVGGLYFNNCCCCEPSASSLDAELASALWKFSNKLLQEKINDDEW
ncbi:WW domain-containing oxidoreductase-like [Pomacea canaliculata]|uniref:WW domain-containing oxidoreductase-like n=1 Tax=Pomacea canaliculata TaxID=400727 RepID=UPI000D73BE1A|nr:WW domain-containing oxidoreductase-like [Pomacea canaliculata]